MAVASRSRADSFVDADESEVYFDQHDSFELMRCLEEIDTRSKTNASLLQPIQTLLGGQGNWDTTALTLRLSLTKNLSRCLCMA